jgi:hypothetical protein
MRIYFTFDSSCLEKAYHKYKDDEHGNFIVIGGGYPKAMSLYSLENMNKFLSDKSKTVQAFRKK